MLLDLQYPRGVLVVLLLENRLRQPNPINSPAALGRDSSWSVVEVFVFGFEKTKIDLVQLVVENLLRELVTMRGRIGAKKNAVLIFVEKLTRSSGLASKFSDARRQVNEHVRIAIEILRHVLQIFREVAYVHDNELRPGMSSDDPIASGNQLVITRKVSSMERPVGMIVQLLIALVEAIRGRKECDWIRNMNRHRKIKLAAGIPHRIKTRVINFHQRTCGYVFTKIESQRFEDFQASP